MNIKWRLGFVVMAVSLAVLVVGVSGIAVYAQTEAAVPTVGLEVPIGTITQVKGIAEYIQIFYRFTVAAVAIIAATMIMYAGISWLTAAGSSQKIGEAKERITAAISGLILAMLSYAILNTINPELIVLQNPSILVPEVPQSISEALADTGAGSSTSADACEAEADWVDIGDYLSANNPAAASIYATNHGTSTGVEAEETTTAKLGIAYQAADLLGMTLYLNSAARSYADQQRLYNCWVASGERGHPYCTSDCKGCNQAARPACDSAPHMSGKALDLTWYPKSDWDGTSPYLSLNGLAKKVCNGTGDEKCPIGDSGFPGTDSTAGRSAMNQSQIKLQEVMKKLGFQRICLEWWHFEYNGPSGSVCEPGDY